MLDIETDGLDATVIWVLCAINVATGEEVTIVSLNEMKEWIDERLAEGCAFVGHNILSFDAPTLNRLARTRIPTGRCVDTFVLSMHYSPGMAGGHSLGAWGQRLGFSKGEWSAWSRLSDGMVAYCLRDCRVNVRLYTRLTERMRSVGFTDRACELEHRAWSIIRRQRLNGFQLNVPAAHELFAELRALEKQLKDEIYEQWPPQLEVVKRFKKACNADGGRSANYRRHLEQYPELRDTDDGGYEALDWVEFNLGSPPQRIAKLLELGWEPREFTPKGSPQATRKGNLVPSLEAFLAKTPNKSVRLLAEWIAINARANNIGTWIDLADTKGLLHGNLWLAGTLRYRHDKPNTANIPAVRVGADEKPLLGRSGVYTYEARDLWITRDRERRRLVGVDAKGIQLRILAEYIKDDAFTEAILSEDPHSANQARMGLPSRSLTKTITYATLMGAGDAKIADTAKVSLKEARAAKATFMATIPGLPKLVSRLQAELSRTGRITLCDGSRILVPSDHMVIPYLLQGDESRIMKQAMIYVDKIVRKEKLDALKVGDIHDEWQTDVLERDVRAFIEGCERAFPKAGRSFNYRVPIECDAKVGLTWAETH